MNATLSAPSRAVPYLVSFPRTGSHWLRMFLELYFDRPLLTRSFFEHTSTEPLLLHTHDLKDEVRDRRDTVYLYRSVTATVFSELTYHQKEAAADVSWSEVERVALAYRRNLVKWLLRADAAARLHTLTYESLLDRPVLVLPPLIEFLGGEPDVARIAALWPTVTHELVAGRTTHDPAVIAADREVHLRREIFRYRHARRILELFHAVPELAAAMDPALLQ